jgi:hypothetical protein
MMQPSPLQGHRQPAAGHGRRLPVLALRLAVVLAGSATIATIVHLPAAHGEDAFAPDTFEFDTVAGVPDIGSEQDATTEQVDSAEPVPPAQALDTHQDADAEAASSDRVAIDDDAELPELIEAGNQAGNPAPADVANIPASPDATTDPASREGADATRTVTVAEEASALSSDSAGGAAATSGQPAAGSSPPSTGSKQVPPMATDGDPITVDTAWINPGRPADPNADLHPRVILTAQRFARLPLLLAAGPRSASLALLRAARSPILRTGANRDLLDPNLDLLDPNLDPGENFVTALQAVSRSFDACELNSGNVESWAAAAETLAGRGSIDEAMTFANIARTLAEHLEREAGSTRQLAEFATAYANTLSRRDHPSAPKALVDAAGARTKASQLRELAWRAAGTAIRATDTVDAAALRQRRRGDEPYPGP